MRQFLLILMGALIGFGAGYAFFDTGSSTWTKSAGQSAIQTHGAMPHALQEIDRSKPVPSVSMTVTKDSKDGYNVHVTTENYSFTPENAGEAPVSNTGHAHLYVNGVKVARVYSEWLYVGPEFFRDGENIVEVTLNANDHSEWVIDDAHIAADATVNR